MIDEKKLIEDIKKEQCTLYEYGSLGDCQEYEPVNGMYAANVMRAIERQPKIGEWIPCKERLSDFEVSENVKVGICTDNGKSFLITDAEGYVYGFVFWAVAKEFKDEAIAWMPKPEPFHGEKTEAGI